MRNFKSQMILPWCSDTKRSSQLYKAKSQISNGCFRPFWWEIIKGFAIFLHSCNKHRSKSLAFSGSLYIAADTQLSRQMIFLFSVYFQGYINFISWCIKTKLILKINSTHSLSSHVCFWSHVKTKHSSENFTRTFEGGNIFFHILRSTDNGEGGPRLNLILTQFYCMIYDVW